MIGRIVFASLAVLLCAQGQAQSMYRCGSTYQDRPCDGAGGKKLSANDSGTPSAGASPKAAVDPNCARRGSSAEKIKWAREAGGTQEMQLAAARDGQQRELIAEVYGRSGTSGEVRAAVEAACMSEKDNAAQAARLMEAAAKLQGAKKLPEDVAKK